MITNGLEHNLRIGALVWSLNHTTNDEIFKIVNITEERIVCRHVGYLRDGVVYLTDRKYVTSNHTPDNLFEVERHVRITRY